MTTLLAAAEDGPRAFHPSLASLLDRVDGLLLVAGDTVGSVSDVVLWESGAPDVVAPGHIVLAVGVDPMAPEAAAVVLACTTRGAAGVAFRGAPAAAPGIAVLAVAPWMRWDDLYRALRDALGTVEDERAQEAGDYLFTLADATAAALGGPVVIDDHAFRLLAYSTLSQPLDALRVRGIVARRAPDDELTRMRRAGVLHRLRHETEPVRVTTGDGHRDRLGIAVRNGSEFVGAIFVAEGDRPLGPEAAPVLEEAARSAALAIVRLRNPAARADRREVALHRVLDGEVSAADAGLPSPCRVVVLTADDDLGRQRLRDIVTLRLRATGRAIAVTCIGQAVYAVVADSASATPTIVTTAEAAVADACAAVRLAVRAGVGSLGDVHQSRRDAERALRIATAGSAVAFDDVRHLALLDELRACAAFAHPRADGVVAAMAAHDERNHTSYLETIRVYLDQLSNAAAAARELHLHHNTVRYRVARAEALFGLDLRDPVIRLVTHLELHLWPGAPA